MGRPVADLNQAQNEAVHTLSGPLLVLAGAGTGKTRVITYRIAQLIKTGTTPSRILAVTFTNKAAREMKERAQHLLGRRPPGTKPPEISTFHSLCVRVLRRHANRLGIVGPDGAPVGRENGEGNRHPARTCGLGQSGCLQPGWQSRRFRIL